MRIKVFQKYMKVSSTFDNNNNFSKAKVIEKTKKMKLKRFVLSFWVTIMSPLVLKKPCILR